MIAVAPYPTVNAKTRFNVLEYDPTHTLTLRNAFVRDLNGRFNRLIADIRKAVIKEDVFGLKKAKPTVFATPGAKAFEFVENPQKVNEFMDWLKQEVDAGILETRQYEQFGKAIYEPWTNTYIQDSYKRGIRRARYEMRNAGFKVPKLDDTGGIEASMSTPFHIDRVGLLYIRAYNELKGITEAMGQQIARVLSQGMADGEGPIDLAKKMVAVIKDAGAGELGLTDTLGRFIPARRRAEIMARTEIIRAHHKAMVQEYKNWDIKGFKIKAEWSTAGDTRVCDICGAYEGSVWSLKEIENMIPIHPQCRCVALPNPIKEQVGQPVAEVEPKPEVDKVAANFKNEKDAKAYLKYKKQFQTNFDKLSDDDKAFLKSLRRMYETNNKSDWIELRERSERAQMKSILKKVQGAENAEGMSDFMFNLTHWKNSTQRPEANAVKFLAKKLEKKLPDMVFEDDRSELKMLRYLNKKNMNEFQNQYIQWRALVQVYLENTSSFDTITLYRGVSGRTGKNIAMKIYNAWKSGKMQRTLYRIKDMPLIGYSADFSVAEDFGHLSFGEERMKLVLRQKVQLKDIMMPSDLFDFLYSGDTMAEEKEFILIGKNTNWSLKDLYLRVGNNVITDFE